MYNSSVETDDSTSMFNETVISSCSSQGTFGMVLAIIITSLCFTVGIPIHCCSLWVILHSNIKPSLVFPLNMTILELTYCFLCLISLIFTIEFSVEIYILNIFFYGICWTVRPLLQVCICLEQYLAVIHPVTFLRYKGIEYRIALAATAWLIGLANSLRLIFIPDLVFPDFLFLSFFCIAVIITSFCCTFVLHALRRPGPGDRSNAKVTEKGRAAENQQKRKAFRIISHILVSILVCYLPLVVAYFMRGAQLSDQSCYGLVLIVCITMLSVLTAPLIRMYNDGHLKPKMWLARLGELRKGK